MTSQTRKNVLALTLSDWLGDRRLWTTTTFRNSFHNLSNFLQIWIKRKLHRNSIMRSPPIITIISQFFHNTMFKMAKWSQFWQAINGLLCEPVPLRVHWRRRAGTLGESSEKKPGVPSEIRFLTGMQNLYISYEMNSLALLTSELQQPSLRANCIVFITTHKIQELIL